MRTITSCISFLFFVALVISSCKKDYQKITTEFVRNLPDSCELLVQVDNNAEHLVYYKSQRKDAFYCYNAEKDLTETINVPREDLPDPKDIGAGDHIILVGYNDKDGGEMLTNDDMFYARAMIMKYDIKTRKFQEFVSCNNFEFNYNTKQLICNQYGLDRYGGGSCTHETYDFDGKLLTSNEVEIYEFQEVPSGTNADKQKEISQGIDEELDSFEGIIESANSLMIEGWPTTSNMGIKVCNAYTETYENLLRLHSKGFTDQQESRFEKLSKEAKLVFSKWESQTP